MCGIVSIIARTPGGFYQNDMDLFENLLILDQFRGKDAAGIMTTFRNGDQQIIKHASKHISLLFETKQWKEMRGRVIGSGRFITGHNRFATRGKKTSDEAHPFNHGKISLVHNGTIWNQKVLAPDATVEVDSESIAIALDAGKTDDVLKTIDGAFALIWYDSETEQLYATRNTERPLGLVTTANYYFLLSEPWMLTASWHRQNGRAKLEEFREVEPGEVLSFDMNGKMGRREVVLPEKKTYGQASTTGTGTTSNGFPNQRNRSIVAVTREAVEAQSEETPNDPIPSFTEGTPGDKLTSIRETLTRSARIREERQRGTNCALTQGTDSETTTKNEPDTKKVSTSPEQTDIAAFFESTMQRQRNIIVSHPEYKPGTRVLVKLVETLWQGKFLRWNGKINMPGKLILDAVGVLPEGVTHSNEAQWTEGLCSGIVNHVTYSSGGYTIWVCDLAKAQYTDIHGNDIPWAVWSIAMATQLCSHCGGKLFDWERPFTSVRMQGRVEKEGVRQNMSCVCPDCLLKALPNGEIYDGYAKRYNEAKTKYLARCNAEGTTPSSRDAPVQNRKSVSEKSVTAPNGTIIVPSPKTLQ